MNKKLKIDFHADLMQEVLIESFAVMVARHNAGTKGELTLLELQGYFHATCVRHGIEHKSFLDGFTLSLYIRNKPFLTVYEIDIIGEITANEADLITQRDLS